MSQDKKDSGMLASSLFGKAAGENANVQAEKARAAIERGALEQAVEHLKRAARASESAWLLTPSPLLTEDENKRMLELRAKYKDEIMTSKTPREEIKEFSPPEVADWETDNYLSDEELEMEELILLERKAGNLDEIDK